VLGLVGDVAIIAIIYGEVIVDAIVDPQRHAVERDAVVVDHEPLLVELQIVVAYRLAVDCILHLIHRTVVRHAPQRARDVALAEVLDETAHVVRYLHLVREGQAHFIDETVNDGKLRTVRVDVYH